MEYEPKIIPEGINTSKEHPIREFLILVGGIGFLIFIVIYALVISSDYLIEYIPVEKENEWFSYEEINNDDVNNISTSSETQKTLVENYLYSIVEKLQDDKYRNYRFTVTLIDEEAPNAFITPGGHIFVTDGLLKTVTSENALAMVLGHEMAHQYHRHTLKAMGRGVVIALGLMIITGFDDSDLSQNFIGSSVTLSSLVFSREQERQADATGVELLLRSYGSASGATEFFDGVKRLEDSEYVPVFLSTHPGTEERIRFLGELEQTHSGDILPLPGFVLNYRKLVKDK